MENIKARKGFVVHIADAGHVVEADYFGIVSGNAEIGGVGDTFRLLLYKAGTPYYHQAQIKTGGWNIL